MSIGANYDSGKLSSSVCTDLEIFNIELTVVVELTQPRLNGEFTRKIRMDSPVGIGESSARRSQRISELQKKRQITKENATLEKGGET